MQKTANYVLTIITNIIHNEQLISLFSNITIFIPDLELGIINEITYLSLLPFVGHRLPTRNLQLTLSWVRAV